MNLPGHVVVAVAVGGSGAVLTGAALPDVAAMGRFRLTRPPAGTALADGVALHHRTDAVFHRHPWFVDLNLRVTTALTAAGVGRGPARAIGHVGVELLLDGPLLAEPGSRAAVTAALAPLADPSHDVVGLVDEADRARWRHHLDTLSTARPGPGHHRPAAVADRLHRILAGRPRLALPADAVTTVTSVLDDHLDEISAGADGLVADVVADLGRDGSTDRFGP